MVLYTVDHLNMDASEYIQYIIIQYIQHIVSIFLVMFHAYDKLTSYKSKEAFQLYFPCRKVGIIKFLFLI